MSIPGIDVSHFNGLVDWNAVSASMTFAFAKATQGASYVDPRFAHNWAGMHDAGLLRGAYHFFDPSQDAEAQAHHFLETVQPDAAGLPPVLDVETLYGATSAVAVSGMNRWIEIVQQAVARPPIVYTSATFWRRLGDPPRTAFADSPLWVAHYGVSAPNLPKVWNSWTFWQFSDSGRCPGIAGRVDLNRFAGTLDQLRVLAPAPSVTT